MTKLQDVTFTNYTAASAFIQFLDALHKGKYIHEACQDFQDAAHEAVRKAGIAQEVMVQLREDLRIVVGQISTMISGDDKKMTSFIAESSQTMLKLATAAEECGGILEEYRDEWKEVQRQTSDEKDNPPSEEEFQVVQEKWQAFFEMADRFRDGWYDLREQMYDSEDSRGSGHNGEPVMTSPNNPTSPIIAPGSARIQRAPFWRKLFRRISSCLTLETVS